MNVLYKKELTLGAKPAFAGLMAGCLVEVYANGPGPAFFLAAIFISTMIFGAEYQFGTLLSNFAQPTPRTSIWSAKLGAAYFISLIVAALLQAFFCVVRHREFFIWDFLSTFFDNTSAAIFPIALFCTWLRSGLLAFGLGFTGLVLLSSVTLLLREDHLVEEELSFQQIALLSYSLLAFFAARFCFLGQEIKERISPSVHLAISFSNPTVRRYRGWRALLQKELQLMSPCFLLVLFVIFIGFFGSHWASEDWVSQHPGLHGVFVICHFGQLLLPPLLIGSFAFAEETEMGLQSMLLTLPVRKSIPFVIKALVMLILTGLAGFLVWTLEVNFPVAWHVFANSSNLLWVSASGPSLAAMAFLASSLSRSTVQGFTFAIVASVLLGIFAGPLSMLGVQDDPNALILFLMVQSVTLPVLLILASRLNYSRLALQTGGGAMRLFATLCVTAALVVIQAFLVQASLVVMGLAYLHD